MKGSSKEWLRKLLSMVLSLTLVLGPLSPFTGALQTVVAESAYDAIDSDNAVPSEEPVTEIASNNSKQTPNEDVSVAQTPDKDASNEVDEDIVPPSYDLNNDESDEDYVYGSEEDESPYPPQDGGEDEDPENYPDKDTLDSPDLVDVTEVDDDGDVTDPGNLPGNRAYPGDLVSGDVTDTVAFYANFVEPATLPSEFAMPDVFVAPFIPPVAAADDEDTLAATDLIAIDDAMIPLAPAPVPLARTRTGSWSLATLLFALLTAALAIATFVLNVKKPKELRTKYNYAAMAASALLVVCSALLFVFTQNFGQPMLVFDIWTVWMGTLTFGQITALVCTAKLIPDASVVETKQD